MSWISDVKYELGKLEFSRKVLRKFGILIGLIAIVITIYFTSPYFISIYSIIFFGIGIYLLIFGIFFPKKLSSLYKIWMGVAFALGWVVSRFLLTIIFFLVLTPIALLAKIFRKRFLFIEMNKTKNSYWILKKNKINYEKMF